MKTGCIPLPYCQFFQIHGSILKLYPHTDSFQPPVWRKAHAIFLLCICEDPFYCLRPQLISQFSMRRVPDVFCLFYVILPDMAEDCFLAALAFCTHMPCRAYPALVWQALILPVPVPVSRAVRQAFVFRANDHVQILVIYIFMPFVPAFFRHGAFIRQGRDPVVLKNAFAYPRRFVACVHYNRFYLRELFRNTVIERVKSNAVMYVPAGDGRVQYKVMPVADCMGFIGKAALVLPFMEHPAFRVCR